MHVLGEYISSLPTGEELFPDITPANVNPVLREFLGACKVPDARFFVSHDIRRGHGKDIQMKGGTVAQLLEAGEWTSPAFLKYMDMQQLEHDRAMEAHDALAEEIILQSDEEDEEEDVDAS